tara:strand:+ start:684 stop:944 length:261 start_codon:yes stop_codon:yes gene_type:complete
MPYHAFYSEKQKNYNISINNTITNTRRSIHGIPVTYNYITYNNQVLETTSVYNIDFYPTENSCHLIYDDKIYLGIVEKLHSAGYKL